MTDFLSCAEYEKMASALALPAKVFIGGRFCDAKSGKTMENTNPATGKPLGSVPSCGKEDVDAAVAAAKKTFESGVWSRMHPTERKKIFLRFVGLMEKHMVELALL